VGVARNVIAPVAGRVMQCLVQSGEMVAPDTEVAIVEAMKMHIPVVAEQAGRVALWLVSEDSQVTEGQALLALED
jgi:acetyl-CoA carboxylase biotin carboxyl carrier protein